MRHSNREKSLVLPFIFVMLFFSKGSAFAKLITAGSLDAYYELSDNMFSTSSDTAVSGTTYLISPTITFTLPGKKKRLNLGYTFGWEENKVDETPDANAVTPNLTNVSGQGGYGRKYHSLSSSFGWDLTRKVNLNLSANYDINYQSLQVGQTVNFSPQEQTRTDTNRIDLTVLWRPTKKLNVSFAVSRDATLYDNSIVANVSTLGGNVTLTYNISQKIQLGAGVIYSTIEYDSPSQSIGDLVGGAPNPSLVPGTPNTNTVSQNYVDRVNIEYNANLNVNLKYFIIGLSYGILQTRQANQGTATTFNFGGTGFNVDNSGGGLGTTLASIFSLNITSNSKTLRFKNFTFNVDLGQQFYMDISGQPYIGRVIGAGVAYKWKSINTRLALDRSQDSYLNNDNEVNGTTGSFLFDFAITKKLSLSYTWSLTKYEFKVDETASSSTTGTGNNAGVPSSLPNQSDSVVQEMYLNLSYSWNKWLTSGVSFGRRESELLNDLGPGQIGAGYVENIMSFSTTATF